MITAGARGPELLDAPVVTDVDVERELGLGPLFNFSRRFVADRLGNLVQISQTASSRKRTQPNESKVRIHHCLRSVE